MPRRESSRHVEVFAHVCCRRSHYHWCRRCRQSVVYELDVFDSDDGVGAGWERRARGDICGLTCPQRWHAIVRSARPTLGDHRKASGRVCGAHCKAVLDGCGEGRMSSRSMDGGRQAQPKRLLWRPPLGGQWLCVRKHSLRYHLDGCRHRQQDHNHLAE